MLTVKHQNESLSQQKHSQQQHTVTTKLGQTTTQSRQQTTSKYPESNSTSQPQPIIKQKSKSKLIKISHGQDNNFNENSSKNSHNSKQPFSISIRPQTCSNTLQKHKTTHRNQKPQKEISKPSFITFSAKFHTKTKKSEIN